MASGHGTQGAPRATKGSLRYAPAVLKGLSFSDP
jgi:hypothetical protein